MLFSVSFSPLSADAVIWVAQDITNQRQGEIMLKKNVTKLKQAKEKFQEKDEKYRLLARNFPNGVVLLFDHNLRYTLAEGMGFKAAEVPGELLEGKTLWEASPTAACKLLEPLYRKALAGEASTIEIPDGERIDLVHILPVTNQHGEIDSGMVITYDITEHKHLQKQLEKYAFYEPLTNLPNKTWFLERLERQIQWAKAEKTGLFAVLFLELERFEVIKYSLGHQIADQLMVATAQRLEGLLSFKEPIARVGDNSLAILLADLQGVSEATNIADRIHQQLMLPFNLDGHEVFSTASIGIALGESAEFVESSPQTNPNPLFSLKQRSPSISYNRPEALLRAADTARHHAKELPHVHYAVFTPQMHERAVARLELEVQLRRAIEHQQLRVYYQPIIFLKTGKISGFEALVRWLHPTKGMVSPAEFIPLAEESELINLIDWWVMRQACQQLKIWQQKFVCEPPLNMSVNLSSLQQPKFGVLEQLKEIMLETGVDGGSLKLEITETTIMNHATSKTSILEKLKALGIKLSIDDFGTGYSSLARLHKLPIDTLKIDRSFVAGIGIEDDSLEIIRTIIKLAHSLEMDLIAEGIETPQHLAQLRSLQCEYGQGYFFSKPLDRNAAEELFAAQLQW